MHTIINHPLVQHRITHLRQRETPAKTFRELVHEITFFLAYEALRDLQLENISIQTPLTETLSPQISERLVIIPILRAGLGMLPAMQTLLPTAPIGVLGIQRNEQTGKPEPYYAKIPPAHAEDLALVIDPMLATGGSICEALRQLKQHGYRRLRFLNLIASQPGLEQVEAEHPDVPIFTAAKDLQLNEHLYILPGLGDAGDRLFGTDHPFPS